VWHAAEQAWYWVDIPARRIWRLDHASRALRHWTAGEMVACIAPRASGGLIAGMETGIFALELLDDGQVAAERLGAPGCRPSTRPVHRHATRGSRRPRSARRGIRSAAQASASSIGARAATLAGTRIFMMTQAIR
jgi:hypothetical protein